MPIDPVKAVFWFFHWSLKVLVRFFWLPILGGIIYEGLINGFVGGIVTLLVGLGVWLGLAVVLFFFNVSTKNFSYRGRCKPHATELLNSASLHSI